MGIYFAGAPWLNIVLPGLLQDSSYVVTFIISIACMMILIIFVRIMPKRTEYGNEILGKLRGFKRFLETAEKPQLESLVYQNPEYFYNILPYTYALGVSKAWMKQFETIAMKAPDWYVGCSTFNIHKFNVFMSQTMTRVQSAMRSSPSSGSGSSSGGGFSGGGSGRRRWRFLVIILSYLSRRILYGKKKI